MTIPINIATNWDPGLIQGLAALNRACANRQVAEVFGSHRLTPTGTARPRERLPFVGEGSLESYVNLCREHGIRFNYLLNGIVPGQLAADPQWRRELSLFLEELQQGGITLLTVSDAAVIRWIRCNFAGFSVKVSLLAQVDSAEKARVFEDMGVETIVLDPFYANRNFRALREIRAAVRCKLELYSNVSCLAGCPVSREHYRFLSESSSTNTKAPRSASPDPYLGFCSLVYLQNPVEVLKSPFIRPEDVGEYAAMGIDQFKLSDRSESTEYLLMTAAAYLRGCYDGDLFSLVFRKGSKFRGGMRLGEGMPEGHQPFAIDNPTLDRLGFFKAISTLSGDALAEFYERAVREAVSRPNDDTMSQWREKYPPLIDSVRRVAEKRYGLELSTRDS